MCGKSEQFISLLSQRQDQVFQPNVKMQVLSTSFVLILIFYLLMKISDTKANENNLCPLSVPVSEIRRHYDDVKDILHDKDEITEIILLSPGKLNNIQPSEACCFILELSRFYLKNVFPNVKLDTAKQQRSLYHLANSFLGMKIEFKHCQSTSRCSCREQSHQTIKDFKEKYHKMNEEAAALKAVGDLNNLFRWMEKVYH